MVRDLNTLPIPPHVRFKLHSRGFSSTDDLMNFGPLKLSEETQLTPEEALDVLDLISSKNEDSAQPSFVVSALDILLEESSKPAIVTFCQRIDEILGGGIPLRKVTEICGCPGSGKTQMCLQLSVNAQVPESCGGVAGESIFIDTEGSFFVERLAAIADATVEHCKKIISQLSKDAGTCGNTGEFNTKKVLEGVHCYRCKNFTELIALVNILPEFLREHPKVRFIAIDSISFHFRYGFEKSYDRRNKLLNGLSQSLVKIAIEFGVAIVLTNQMTTRFNCDSGPTLVPALGESWGHACTIRLILSFDDNRRKAHLFKCPWKEDGIAIFEITAFGIRDSSKPVKMQGQNKNIQSLSEEMNFTSLAEPCQPSTSSYHSPARLDCQPSASSYKGFPSSDQSLVKFDCQPSMSSKQLAVSSSGSVKLDCQPSISSYKKFPSSDQNLAKSDCQPSMSSKQAALSPSSSVKFDCQPSISSCKKIPASDENLIKFDCQPSTSSKQSASSASDSVKLNCQPLTSSCKQMAFPQQSFAKLDSQCSTPFKTMPSLGRSVKLDSKSRTSSYLQPFKRPRRQ